MLYLTGSAARKNIAIAAVCLSALYWPSLVSAQNPRVNLSPDSIAVALEEPILCPAVTPAEPCQVLLELTFPSNTGVTFNPSSLVWEPENWNQAQTFEVTVAAGTLVATANGSDVITLSSRSELYSGFQPGLQLTVGAVVSPVPLAPLWLLGMMAGLLSLVAVRKLRKI
jgi:hypothetical protein